MDIGGTTVKLGLFTEKGELLEKWEIPTNTENQGAAILPDVAQAVEACLARRGFPRTRFWGWAWASRGRCAGTA